MTTKYYLKEKCKYCNGQGGLSGQNSCTYCRCFGFTRGADVTELIERLFKSTEDFRFIELFKSTEDFRFIDVEDLIEVVEE